MTGKAYYLTTLGEWQRQAARFANSHFIVLDPRTPEPGAETAATCDSSPDRDAIVGAGLKPAPTANDMTAHAETKILVLIEADEGVHLSLEDDSPFETR